MPDEPYSNEDLLDPDFDPFEAHRQWIARRNAVPPQSRIDEALARLDEHMAKWRAEQAKPKKRGRKPKPKFQTETQKWKAALKELKRRKREESD